MNRDAPPPWDPFGLWRGLMPAAAQMAQAARPFADAAGSLGSLGARTALSGALSGVIDVVRRRLIGRQVTLGSDHRRLTLTLTTLDVDADPVLLAAGQADGLVLEAREVTWGALRFLSARARLHNLHTRPAPRPVVVAAPVDIEAVLPGEVLAEAVSRRTSRVVLDVTSSGVRLRLARYPDWGWVDVTPSVEGDRLFLRAATIGRRTRDWGVARRLPPVHVGLDLPEGVRVTALEPGPDRLTVHFRVDEWRLEHRDILAFAAAPSTAPARKPAP